jgi:hypothetical protein
VFHISPLKVLSKKEGHKIQTDPVDGSIRNYIQLVQEIRTNSLVFQDSNASMAFFEGLGENLCCNLLGRPVPSFSKRASL